MKETANVELADEEGLEGDPHTLSFFKGKQVNHTSVLLSF